MDFCSGKSFNQPLLSWDVSSAANMNHMFHGASSFNQDLSFWDVSRGYDMSYMLRCQCLQSRRVIVERLTRHPHEEHNVYRCEIFLAEYVFLGGRYSVQGQLRWTICSTRQLVQLKESQIGTLYLLAHFVLYRSTPPSFPYLSTYRFKLCSEYPKSSSNISSSAIRQ